MDLVSQFFTFQPQCCDADNYLVLGQGCALDGLCYDRLRPVGAILWFSIPYRLGLPPALVLISLRLVLLSISIALSVLVLWRSLVSLMPDRRTRWLGGVLVVTGCTLAHVTFFLPVLSYSMADNPANAFALIAIWFLILVPDEGRTRLWMIAGAGLCLGLAAWIRVFFLYPVLAILLVWLLAWLWGKKKTADLLLFLALLPISIQYSLTWQHTHRFSYVDPAVTSQLVSEHRDNIYIGYDMVLDSRGVWYWKSSCNKYQALLPALEQGDMHSVGCILSGRLNFYLGSYSASNFVEVGGYEALFGRNMMHTWDCNKGNPYIWKITNLRRDDNIGLAPDNTRTADHLVKLDRQLPAEIYQSISLRSEPSPYLFSTWLWEDPATMKQPSVNLRMLIRNHVTGEVIAARDLVPSPTREVKFLDGVITMSGVYDMVIQSPPGGPDFYLWEEFDLRRGEPFIEGASNSRIRIWSPWLLMLNVMAIVLAIHFTLRFSTRARHTELLTGLLVILLFGQAMISLPEQRFAITPMVIVWVGCLGSLIAWFLKRYFPRTDSGK